MEVCCSNLDYDAKNILAEAKITEIDQVIAVASDKGTKTKLEKALEKVADDQNEDGQAPIRLLDAAQCLANDFGWADFLLIGDEDKN